MSGVPPREELINVFEVEAVAKRKLAPDVYAAIAGGDRAAFERITFRPRMMVNVVHLDLSVELFGEKLFTPILVGPMSEQRKIHPEGELAMARGASAGKAPMVVSGRASFPVDKIAAAAKTLLWFQVYPEPDMNAAIENAQRAVGAGCKAVCLTLGASKTPLSWSEIDRLRGSVKVPLLLKGIMSAEEARTAVERGAQGIVVSNHGAAPTAGVASPIEVLPSIVDAVGGKAPVLIDGSFRRGTDVLKALAFGARAVLVGRPALWGLGAYGADGVQTVLQMLQSELARDMGLAGKPTIESIDRSLVKVHRR